MRNNRVSTNLTTPSYALGIDRYDDSNCSEGEVSELPVDTCFTDVPSSLRVCVGVRGCV